MSAKNVKAFFEKVAEDKALQAKLRALDKKAGIEKAIADLVKIASAAGFEFTAQDLAQARRAQARKLSASELKTVAAGDACWLNSVCYSAYYCKLGTVFVGGV